jgi:hypothetical protein
MDRGRGAAHGVLHQHSAGQYTFRVQAANNDGVWNTAGAALTFELRPHFYQTCGFMRCWCWPWWAGAAGAAAAAEARGARVQRACWASATALRARFTTRWRRGMWASACSWKCWPSCCGMSRVDAAAEASGPDARLRARGAGRRAAVDLGAALAGLGRDHAAGAAAAHGGGGGQRQARGELQHLWRLPAACRRAPSARFCAWRRRPSIM